MGGRGASYYAQRTARAMLGSSNGSSGGQSIPIDISKLKDKSLQGVENRIRKLNHEEAYIFDQDDNLVAGVSGGSSSVNVPFTWDTMDGATVTHGHPVGDYNFGGTLSLADASRMANTNWSEMRASANGKGEFNYIMRRTPNSDNRGLLNQIGRDQSRLENDIVNAYKNAYNNAISQGKSASVARHESAQIATGVVQAYWRVTLPQYGFEFVTPKKGYEYGR